MDDAHPTTDTVTLAAVDPARAADLSAPAVAVNPPGGMLDLTRNVPIADVVWRRRAQVGGRVRSIRVRPWGEVPTLEAVIVDSTGALTVGFLGRRRIPGITLGCSLTVEGMVGVRNNKLLILNPAYDLRPLAR